MTSQAGTVGQEGRLPAEQLREELQSHLEKIVDRRKQRLPWCDEGRARLDEVEGALGVLRETAGQLPSDWASDPGIRDALDRLNNREANQAIGEARQLLEVLQARFARETVNVGVCGRARVGKSSMLQAVSGLRDDQVPTGDTTNVTAVRSRIFHATREFAEIQFYDRASFFDEVVRPYFGDLGIAPAPTSLDQFERADLTGERTTQKKEGLRNRLKMIQKATPSLPLDGGKLLLENDLFSDLRRYVAYERTEDRDREENTGERAPRDYLAVRDCRIETPFPLMAVNRLGLVDLPGLGEVAKGIDDRIAGGIRGEVDVVLLVFRAAKGLATITNVDLAAVDLLARAQGAIRDSKDFVWAVINAGPGDESRAADLRSQIQRELNGGSPDSRHIVVEADGRSDTSMHENVLEPVLKRLATRLDAMDQDLIDDAVAAISRALQPAEAAAAQLTKAISRLRVQSGSVRQDLDKLAREFRKDIQQSLKDVQPMSLVDESILGYEQQLDDIHRDIEGWLAEGLGIKDANLSVAESTKEAWIAYADRERGLAETHTRFAYEELHRLRVEVTRRYSDLDTYVNDELIDGFYDMVCKALAGVDHTNIARANRTVLLSMDEPTAAARLTSFLRRLEACDPTVPGLSRAFQGLAGIRFDFRLQFYPLLQDVNADMRPVDATDDAQGYPPAFGASDTVVMYDWFVDEFTQYSLKVKTELREDAPRQFKILTGAAAVLEDEVSRSGTSEEEFRRLVENHRDELWPGLGFGDVNAHSARARSVVVAAQALRTALDRARETMA